MRFVQTKDQKHSNATQFGVRTSPRVGNLYDRYVRSRQPEKAVPVWELRLKHAYANGKRNLTAMADAYKKDNTKTVITIGFLAVFAFMGLALVLSMATLSSANDEMSALIEDNAEKTSLAYQMRDVIRSRSGAMKSLLQINDPDERELIFDKLINNTDSYRRSRTALEALGANGREQEVLDKVEEADKRVAEIYNKANDKIYSMSSTPDSLKSVLSEVQLQELVLLNQLNVLVQLEKTLAEETLASSQSRFTKIKGLLLTLCMAAFVLSLIISGFVVKRVTTANRKIAHLASHDDLTGLHNRRSFEAQLEHTVAIAPRAKDAYGLMFVDLDRFKIINDTCGHHAGDQLLIQLTQMMQNRLRRGDMLARIGGDEFAIIARGDAFEDIVKLAEELRELVADFDFLYASQTFKVSLSIGVIPIDGVETDLESILSDVDSACYVAKQSGRNRVHVTQEDDAEVVKYRNDIAGMQNIKTALADERLVLFHQPVYRILPDSVETAHSEILLRIKSESGQLFSPAEFIPIAEKYNVMTEIDRWVFSNVVDWLATHQEKFETPNLLINLSGLSFINDEFLEFVVEKLESGIIDPAKLSFEITETAAVDNMHKANVFIDRVHALGCKLALDDFGAGFSTFAYLKELPIDYLKIDGSLVKNLASDNIDREMVKAINEIGHTVGAKTIAEFVEDDEILTVLRQMGVDYAQGYGLGKPRSLDELVHDLKPLEQLPEQPAEQTLNVQNNYKRAS